MLPAIALVIYFEINCDENLIIQTDPVRFKMIITNLLTNAVKYSPSKKSHEIDIHAHKRNGENPHKRLWNWHPRKTSTNYLSLYRFENVGSIKGTGLGLSIVQRELQILEGSIYLNESIKNGAEFIIKIF